MTPCRVVHNCPDSTYTLGNYTDGRYCLKVIPKWSDDTEMVITNPYEMANQYCLDQTGGYLASIHSAAENNAINALQKKLDATSTGAMICLVANSSTITDTDEIYWLDGTDVSYTNYGANFTSDSFTYTLLTTNGQWQSVFDPTGSMFKYIACKKSATATLSPIY
uniref:C-type lectin domain-containing protein n=1 Tax=Panagrellus redivivus TaxID=6233 RepID=A0A7E4ZY49_PANRE